MESSRPHRGVIVPMVTPFTSTGEIDEPAAERLADRLARHGLSVFVLGTTGETSSIPVAQRPRVVAAAVRAAAGRVPVYAGIGDNSVRDAIDAGRRYLGLGVAAVVAHPPSYYPLSADDIEACFRLLHDELPGPLMLYNIPVTTHLSIPLDVVERLSALPRIIGFKDSEDTAGRLEETVRRFAGRKNFSILMGVARLSVPGLQAGFDGLVPSSGNLVPALWQHLWERAEAGDWTAAQKAQQETDAVGRVLQHNRDLGGYLAALKAGLAAQNICSADLLPPLRPLPPVDRAAVASQLAALGVR